MKRTQTTNHIWSLLIMIFIAGTLGCNSDNENTDNTIVSDSSAEEEYLSDYESDPQKWGFINKEGRVEVKAKFDQVSTFSEGLAAVNLKGRWGYIDHKANVVVPYKYLAAWPFSEGLGRVSDFDGSEMFVEATGREIRPDAPVEHVYDFHDGLARVQAYGQFGYMDKNGKISIAPLFEHAWDFENGMARVKVEGLEGLINTEGEFIIEPQYDQIYSPARQPFLVRKGDAYFFVDRYNKRLSSGEYLGAVPYQPDNTAAVRDQTGWHLIDRSETRLTKDPYQSLRPLGEGRWAARNNNGYALLDVSGRLLTAHVYQQINRFSEGLAVFRRDHLCGYMNTAGIEVLPPHYGLAWDFNEGLARAAFRDGIAYVDKQGRVPFIPRHNELRDFSEGLAPFQER